MKMEIVFKNGRRETFNDVASFSVMGEEFATIEAPIEGKLFTVIPLEIDRSCFEKLKRNPQQETARQLILEAFAEVDKHPEKYAVPFYTLIPKMNWNGYKTVEELKEYANDLGGEMANWVEQALEWAQRISNGEDWENICNDADTSKYYRIIVWKNNCFRYVGGSRYDECEAPASDIFSHDYNSNHNCSRTVPLVRIKKK